MSRPPVDRPLRRLVAELAAMRLEDVDAILADLSSAQQAQVNSLLAEYRGGAVPSSPKESAPASGPDHIDGLSEWLAIRIRAAANHGDALATPRFGMPAFAMTDAGRGALLAAAAKASMAFPGLPPVRKVAEPSNSLSGFLSLLRGGRS